MFLSCVAQAFCSNEISLSVTHLRQGLYGVGTCEIPAGWETREIFSKIASSAPKWQPGCLQASEPPQAAPHWDQHMGIGTV